MIKLTFNLPADQQSQNDLALFMESFAQGKTAIKYAIERNRKPVNTTNLDKYVWDDLVTVIGGIKKPIDTALDWTLWSLHMNKPRWGSPLFGLSAYESGDSLTLELKIFEDWTDEEEVPQCIRFKCTEPLSHLMTEWEMIMSSNGIDYWIVFNNDSLLVYLDLIELD